MTNFHDKFCLTELLFFFKIFLIIFILNYTQYSFLFTRDDARSGLVLRHRKFCQYFRESFAKILALKIKSFQNFATILKNSAKIVISKC